MNKKIPNKLLKKLNLVFKNERVYYAKDKFFSISIKKILLLKKFLPKNQRIFRICLHINDKEKIHEMIIVHLKPQTIGPLKQKKQTISYHLLNGKLLISIIEKNKTKSFLLSKKNNKHLRIKCNMFRLVKSLEPNTIFLEIASGPFKNKDTIWKNK